MTEINWDEFPNFERHEFECKCGCGKADMDLGFINKLQLVRSAVGKPMPINSGYRCPGYNMQISSTGADGPHTTGKAVDIACSGELAWQIMQEATALGMTGIGVSQKGDHASRFIHLDSITNGTRPWVWSY